MDDSPTILVLQGNPDSITSVSNQLCAYFPESRIVTIRDQAAYHQILAEGRPDVVIANGQLEWADGAALSQPLRQRHPDCPIILIAAENHDARLHAAVQPGTYDWRVNQRDLWQLPFIVKQAMEQRKQLRGQLRELATLHYTLDALTHSYPAGIVMLDLEGRVTFWNPACERIFGWTTAETLGNSLPTIPPGQEEEHRRFCQQVMGNERFSNHQVIRQRKDGTQVIINLSVAPLCDADGTITGMLGVMLDETQRWMAQQLLQEEEHKYRALFDCANDAILLMKDGRFAAANRKACQMFGCDIEEIIGKGMTAFSPPTQPDGRSSAELVEEKDRAVLAGQNQRFDWLACRKDGSPFEVEVSLTRLMLAAGPHVHAIVRDVSDQKRLERLLLTREERFKAFLENATDIIGVIDPTGVMVYMSPSVRRILGHDTGALLGKQVFEFVHPEDIPQAAAILRQAFAQVGSIHGGEFRIATADGDWRTLEATGQVVADLDEPGAVINARDITGRKENERLLREAVIRAESLAAGTIRALAHVTEVRDPYTAGHQRAVANLSVAIAKDLALPEETVRQIEIAGNLHDIGKISVPAEILAKPGPLTEHELGLVRDHARTGYDILKRANFPEPIADIVRQHHECIDGSGYPDGLRGEAISQPARILAVADAADAIVSHRPYRPALGIDAAVEELAHGRGTRYDPAVVDACVRILKRSSALLLKGDSPPIPS